MALFPPFHYAGPKCALNALENCLAAEYLADAPSFRTALRAFFGKARGSYLGENLTLYDQGMYVLYSSGDAPEQLGDGYRLFTGCKAHECQEKGAVVLSPKGKIVAFGILSFHCHRAPPDQAGCEDGETLDIFVRSKRDSAATAYVDVVKAWGQAKAKEVQVNASPSAPVAPYKGVNLHELAS